MLYWSEVLGASVHTNGRSIGYVENVMLDPEQKVITGFLLERRNWDIRYRYFTYSQIQTIKRDRIDLKEPVDIKTLNKAVRKKFFYAEDILKQSIQDEKGEWIGRVVDFVFDPSKGFVRDIILSGSLVEDIWFGRKRMPVLSQVEFSKELISIDQDTCEEITDLHKGLKKWLEKEP
jgi:uncharacterized protein YrrD